MRLWRLAAIGLFATAACGSVDDAGLDELRPFRQALRPDNPSSSDMFRFDPGDTVESAVSPAGEFRVHFTRLGDNAVPATDADTNGTPDFVDEVALTYDQVLAHYRDTLGFDAPLTDETIIADNGGDGLFDVYLIDFGGQGDGAFRIDACLLSNPDRCVGYMVQENDFYRYGYPSTAIANAILGSHEFFHAVQASYDTEQGSVLSEGSATWATESWNPSLDDFEWQLDGYLNSPERPLPEPPAGPVPAYSYGSAIFFRFLEERYGEDTVRSIWESTRNGSGGIANPDWFEQLPNVLLASAGVYFDEAWTEFATWNLYTGPRADPTQSYTQGGGYPSIATQTVPAGLVDDAMRVHYASAQYFAVIPADRGEMTAALVSTDPTQIEDLALLLAVERNGRWDDVVQAGNVGAARALATTAASRFVVVVVNTSEVDGPSRRPALCIGDMAEVDACRIGIVGEPPAPPADPDDGCLAAVPATLWAALLGLGALASRRRR